MSGVGLRALVVLGGVVGGGARVGLSELTPAAPDAWPWATLTANLAGALALGVAVSLLGPRWRALVGVGLIGAFTTFSALAAETWLLAEAGRPLVAGAYVVVSTAAGLALAATGLAVRR